MIYSILTCNKKDMVRQPLQKSEKFLGMFLMRYS